MARDDEKTRLDDLPVEPVQLAPGHPERIGRFLVRGQLGEGGMGVVFDAWDPELKRRVAVKLLRPALRAGSRDTGAGTRLQREAESMARVSHPNVAHIYEVGQYDGAIFLAMEYIEGDSLREWLERRPRSWRDIVGVFLQAGHGLAAAHAAGLVHRDFKPDNVLVGADGRTRVVDFGLAFPQTGVLLDLESVTSSVKITRIGAVVGTPAYMSPEQHLHQPADARSDQFSFCVALHEALFGERPFRGESIDELRLAVFRPPTVPAGARRLPRRILRILARGLQSSPERRYPDMPALLADLAVDPAVVWQRVGLAVGVLGLLAAVVLATRPADPGLRCPDPADLLAGVWDPARLAAARDGVLATGLAYATDTWPKVQLTLDTWTSAWTAARADACAATHVAHTASEELLHLRNQCLDADLRDLGALVDTLAAADAPTLEHALEAAQGLPEPAACLDEATVRARIKPPADPVLAAAVAAARERLAVAEAKIHAGHLRDARDIAEEVLYGSVALDHPPLHAEIDWLLGQAAEAEATFADSYDHLVRAFDTALAVAHDQVVTDAAIHLAYVCDRDHRYEEGLAWSRHAVSMVARTGDHPRKQSLALIYQASNLSALGRDDEAVAAANKALALAEANFPADDIQLARILTAAAVIHNDRREIDAALAHYRRVRDGWQGVLGPGHPLVARAAYNVGRVLYFRGDEQAGLAEMHAALADLERAQGPDHPDVARVIGVLGHAALQHNRLRDALTASLRARAIFAARHGEDHPDTLQALEGVVEAHRLLGDTEAALTAARQLLARRQTRKPQNPSAIDRARTTVAHVLLDARRWDEAEAECRAVLATNDRDAHPYNRMIALMVLARIARLRGDPRQAETLALRALALPPEGHPDTNLVQLELGEARLALGRADEAVAACTAAVQLGEADFRPDEFILIDHRVCLGRALLARGITDQGLAELERAVKIATSAELAPALRAGPLAALATALRARDPTRAADLAARARADFLAAGPAFAPDAARLARR